MSGDDDSVRVSGPAPGGVGLLIIDMLGNLAFEGSEALLRSAERALPPILRLRAEADRLGVPVVYVNDNHGQWHSERSRIVEYCLRADNPGRDVARRLQPRSDDYFIIKPQFSGFYATNLPVLLPKLGVTRLVMAGMAADICVLFTAADAHMRAYALWAPPDALASLAEERTAWATQIMRDSMGADISPTTALSLKDWVNRAPDDASATR